jgi:hypothetical protein
MVASANGAVHPDNGLAADARVRRFVSDRDDLREFQLWAFAVASRQKTSSATTDTQKPRLRINFVMAP